MSDVKKQDDSEQMEEKGQSAAPPDKREKDDASILKSLLGTLGVDEVITPEHRAECVGFLSSLDLTKNPETNPKILMAFSQKLKEQGYEPQDIHDKSLVLTSNATDTKLSAETKKAIAELNRYAAGSKEPAPYSNVGVYCFKCAIDKKAGIRVYKRGSIDGLAAWLENFARKSGDLGGNVISKVLSTPLRTKTNMAGIAANIERLGLGKYFTVADGKIVEDIKDIQSGAMLDDLLRLRDEHEFLQKLGPQEGLAAAAKLAAEVHAASGAGVGEILANDIILHVEDGQVTGARLTLPDMAYSKDIPVTEQQATDMLDLCFSAGTSGWQTAGEEQARQNLRTVIRNYPIKEVKGMMNTLLEAGRPHYTAHNWLRLGFDRIKDPERVHGRLKEIIKEEIFSEAAPQLNSAKE